MSLVNLAHVCSHLQNASKARLGMTSIPLSKLHLRLMLGLQKQGFLSSVTVGGPMPPQMADDVLGQLEDVGRPKMHVLHEEKGDAGRPEGQETEGRNVERLRGVMDDTAAEPREIGAAAAEQLLAAETARGEETVADAPWLAYPVSRTFNQETQQWTPSKQSTHDDRPGTSATVPSNPALRRLWLGLKYWNNEPVLSKMNLVSKPSQRVWLNSTDINTIVRGREAGYVRGLTRPGECLFVSTDRGVLEARECAEKRVGGMVLCRVL